MLLTHHDKKNKKSTVTPSWMTEDQEGHPNLHFYVCHPRWQRRGIKISFKIKSRGGCMLLMITVQEMRFPLAMSFHFNRIEKTIIRDPSSRPIDWARSSSPVAKVLFLHVPRSHMGAGISATPLPFQLPACGLGK